MKRIIAVIVLIALLFAWNTLTCTACRKHGGRFAEITDVSSARWMCMEGGSGFVHVRYTWVQNWLVGVYIPGLGCFYNDPTPQYVRVGGFELAIKTWFKGFHRVEMLDGRLQ